MAQYTDDATVLIDKGVREIRPRFTQNYFLKGSQRLKIIAGW